MARYSKSKTARRGRNGGRTMKGGASRRGRTSRVGGKIQHNRFNQFPGHD